jgi:glycosyltransferase involved in cell wall biosynthesis
MLNEPMVAKKRRPKLLFLAHPFPPANTSGSVRTWNITKYMARLGWDISVVTPDPNLCRKLNDSNEVNAALQREGVQRILTDHRWRCLLPDHLKHWNDGVGRYASVICRRIVRSFGIERGIGWIKATERACESIKAKEVDIILATGLPFASFTLARRLSHRLGCPYVLDYRDPWTGNPHTAHPFQPAVMRKEAALLASAAAVTIVSPSWAAELDRLFRLGPKLHVVTNGYDPEEFAQVKPYEFDHFAIIYAGVFYRPKRIISPVMAALQRLKASLNANDPKWLFHYYGTQVEHVQEEARRFCVTDAVVLHGHVPRSTVLSAVRGAGIAVTISSVSEEAQFGEKGIIPGKLFEPLGLRTPSLLIAPRGGDAETIITTTTSGYRFTGNEIDGIASYLNDAIHGRIPRLKDGIVYAWPYIASRLDRVLKHAMRSG